MQSIHPCSIMPSRDCGLKPSATCSSHYGVYAVAEGFSPQSGAKSGSPTIAALLITQPRIEGGREDARSPGLKSSPTGGDVWVYKRRSTRRLSTRCSGTIATP